MVENNFIPASIPVGRRNFPLTVTPGTNSPVSIEGREYSGHALDRMQERGLTFSVIENIIQSGEKIKGKIPGTTAYYDPINDVTVITNSSSGRVITAAQGKIKQ